MAVTRNLAVAPTLTLVSTGWLGMAGAVTLLTVRTALLLVALPTLFVTTTEKSAPLSAVVDAGVV